METTQAATVQEIKPGFKSSPVPTTEADESPSSAQIIASQIIEKNLNHLMAKKYRSPLTCFFSEMGALGELIGNHSDPVLKQLSADLKGMENHWDTILSFMIRLEHGDHEAL